MKKSVRFIPSAKVCSKSITLSVENGMIKEVSFEGGCDGNLQGISRLVCGMKTDDVIERLKGISCGNKLSSCPDQLVEALIEMKNEF